MKKILFLLALLFWMLPREASAATGCGYPSTLDTFPNVTTGSILTAADYNKLLCAVEKLESDLRIPNFTVATKPGSPQIGRVIYVTDAIDATTCDTGGGSSRNVCVWNGTNWVTTGAGGGGGGAPTGATYITRTTDAGLSAEFALGSLATGLLKNTTGTGTPTIAVSGTDYYAPGGTDVAVSDGGTGASTQAAAQINLGLVPFMDHSVAYCADVGATDTYSCTNAAVVASSGPITGGLYVFKANTVNTGQASINFSVGGAKIIKKFSGGSKADLADGDIAAGCNAVVTYDGTDMQFLGCAAGTGGGGGTVTGPLATNNCLAKEGTGTTNVTCSSIADDGAGNITIGNTATNYHQDVYAAPSGAITHNWAAVSGDVMQTTGTKTSTQLVSFNASGLGVNAGISTTMARTRSFGFMLGAEDGSTLVATNDQPDIFWNRFGQGITITEIGCKSDAGSPTVMLQRNVAGTLTNIQSGDLTCSTSGATTTTFSGSNNQIANNSLVNLLLQSASTAKRVLINVVFTLD